jgi:uncharacterized protein YbbC (DUF1343 family)
MNQKFEIGITGQNDHYLAKEFETGNIKFPSRGRFRGAKANMQCIYTIYLFFLLTVLPACSQTSPGNKPIQCGAEQTELYLPLLEGKSVAVMANQTSRVGSRHLVDTLLSLGINIKKIFSAEHGFRGNEADGKLITDDTDAITGLPIVSLYGKNHKPSPGQMAGIDIVIFDIQDVGARFYTFISSMHYLMEACAEEGKEFLVLDRPNPNGNYIDGPLLEKGFESFIGLHPVPVVHGMTIAEYARMINGEGWLKDSLKCKLSWVPCRNYKHIDEYILPVSPSPNLPNYQAVRLYPSLAFFEGTIVSEGRGTDFPFQVFGFPEFQGGAFEFTPVNRPGIAVHPKFENQLCKGKDLRGYIPPGYKWDKLNLEWLMEAYNTSGNKENFFKPYFDKLAGTDQLRKDIQAGRTINEIRQSWEHGLPAYRKMRTDYVLYD